MAPSYWFLWAWWLPLMLAGVVADQQAEGCSGLAARCGNLTISDPFWLVDLKTGRSCGHRDFGVACLNNTPVIRSTEILGFAIIEMNYEERSLRAIDLGKLNLLNGSNRCNSFPLIWNTSTKLSSQFQISNMNQNLILYNCTEAPAARRGDRELVETRLSCGNQSEILVGAGRRYDGTSDYGSYALEGYRACVVPVLGSSSGVVNASNYEQLIRNGFLLTLDAPPLASSKRTVRRKILIGFISGSAGVLFPLIYVLIWLRKGKRLQLSLCKKSSSSSTERNYEAMLVTYGSLAPKRSAEVQDPVDRSVQQHHDT